MEPSLSHTKGYERMVRWLRDEHYAIKVINPKDGKEYYFKPRKTDPDAGCIHVKDKNGTMRSVTGENIDGMFIANPRGKNAALVLSLEEIDDILGTTLANKPDLLTVQDYERQKNIIPRRKETIEEQLARIDREMPDEFKTD